MGAETRPTANKAVALPWHSLWPTGKQPAGTSGVQQTCSPASALTLLTSRISSLPTYPVFSWLK